MPAFIVPRFAQDIRAVEDQPMIKTLAVTAIKNYPLIIGEAKVREFDNWKNFATGFFCLFSNSCIHEMHSRYQVKHVKNTVLEPGPVYDFL
jgi:hypothetical protein